MAGRADQPCRRIQRDEEPVRGDPPGSRQLIEQGGLAGVGVADEGDHRIAGGLAAVAHEPAMHPHPLELLAELLDAVADDPAVRLELGLAGSPGPDAAAQPLEVLPLPDQPRQQIGELGQLDLELALHGPRALGEDVQDERGAVDDLEAEAAAEVALLDGREGVVGDHEVGPLLAGPLAQLLDLALAEVEAGRGRPPVLGHPPHHLGACRLRQPAQLVERLVDLEARLLGQPQCGQNGLLARAHSVSFSSRTQPSMVAAAFAGPPAASTSSHRISGSRANQVIWRLA